MGLFEPLYHKPGRIWCYTWWRWYVKVHQYHYSICEPLQQNIVNLIGHHGWLWPPQWLQSSAREKLDDSPQVQYILCRWLDVIVMSQSRTFANDVACSSRLSLHIQQWCAISDQWEATVEPNIFDKCVAPWNGSERALRYELYLILNGICQNKPSGPLCVGITD